MLSCRYLWRVYELERLGEAEAAITIVPPGVQFARGSHTAAMPIARGYLWEIGGGKKPRGHIGFTNQAGQSDQDLLSTLR